MSEKVFSMHFWLGIPFENVILGQSLSLSFLIYLEKTKHFSTLNVDDPHRCKNIAFGA